MKFYSFSFTVLCSIFFLTACSQTRIDPYSERFFNALNQYQGDSLKNMLGFDFKYRSTTFQCNESMDEKCFAAFVSTAYRFQKKYAVKKVINEEQRMFLVEEQGEFLRCLGVQYPIYKISISLDYQGKISGFTIDTIANDYIFQKELHQKGDKFEAWRKKKWIESNASAYRDPSFLTPQELNKMMLEYKKEND